MKALLVLAQTVVIYLSSKRQLYGGRLLSYPSMLPTSLLSIQSIPRVYKVMPNLP